MTPDEALAIAGDIADVDATIRYWQTRGVLVAQVAQQLRCRANWPCVRERMITMVLVGLQHKPICIAQMRLNRAA